MRVALDCPNDLNRVEAAASALRDRCKVARLVELCTLSNEAQPPLHDESRCYLCSTAAALERGRHLFQRQVPANA